MCFEVFAYIVIIKNKFCLWKKWQQNKKLNKVDIDKLIKYNQMLIYKSCDLMTELVIT